MRYFFLMVAMVAAGCELDWAALCAEHPGLEACQPGGEVPPPPEEVPPEEIPPAEEGPVHPIGEGPLRLTVSADTPEAEELAPGDRDVHGLVLSISAQGESGWIDMLIIEPQGALPRGALENMRLFARDDNGNLVELAQSQTDFGQGFELRPDLVIEEGGQVEIFAQVDVAAEAPHGEFRLCATQLTWGGLTTGLEDNAVYRSTRCGSTYTVVAP